MIRVFEGEGAQVQASSASSTAMHALQDLLHQISKPENEGVLLDWDAERGEGLALTGWASTFNWIYDRGRKRSREADEPALMGWATESSFDWTYGRGQGDDSSGK